MNESVARLASRLGLRPPLLWLLAASALLTGVALLWPTTPPVVVANVQEARRLDSPAPPEPSPARVALPAHLHSMELGPAQSDPFVAPVPPAPPAAPIAQPLVGPLYQPPPPPPSPQYRFVGRLTDPSGRLLFVLGRTGRDVLVEQGTVLDDGYVVQSLTPGLITLRHAGSGTIVQIGVSAPAEESRP